MKLILQLNFLFLASSIFGQSFSEDEKLQGYAIHEEKVTFIFDPAIYEVNSDRVLLTFSASRYAQGGIFGVGGWMAAGEDGIQEAIIEWLAEDIAQKLLNYKVFGKTSLN